jgi:hypothetical protein
MVWSKLSLLLNISTSGEAGPAWGSTGPGMKSVSKAVFLH